MTEGVCFCECESNHPRVPGSCAGRVEGVIHVWVDADHAGRVSVSMCTPCIAATVAQKMIDESASA